VSLSAWTAFALALTLLAGQHWRLVRRRDAMNRALHEVRRPLQALALLSPGLPAGAGALSLPPGSASPAARRLVVEPVLQAMAAVSNLDRELNGGPPSGQRQEMLAVRLMADSCVRRWQSRAALSESRIELIWSGSDVLVRGDGIALAAALENLIVNAIEHGGPRITVTGRVSGGKVRIAVRDNGVGGRPPHRPDTPAETIARITGRSRHGHGLAVVDQVAREHGGKLEKEFSLSQSEVTLVLPKASRGSGTSQAVRVNW
jgi:signal transduction histidine kinase